jgi:alpha-1,6-mannosyltransferase
VFVAVTLTAWPVAISLAVAAGAGLGLGWVRGIVVPTTVHSWLAPTNQLGFLIGGAGSLYGYDITATAITLLTRVGALAGCAIVGYLLWTAGHGLRGPLQVCGLTFASLVALGPVVQPWYLLWIVLPLATTPLSDRARWRLAAISAALAVALPPIMGPAADIALGYAVASVAIVGGIIVCRRSTTWARSARLAGSAR